MDAVTVLKHDHRRLEKLVSELQTGTGRPREDLLCQLQLELLSHTAAEERVFFPALQSLADEQADEIIHHHVTARRLVEELARVDSDRFDFAEQFSKVAKDVKEHIEREEGSGGLIDIASQYFTKEDRWELGESIEDIKLEMIVQEAA